MTAVDRICATCGKPIAPHESAYIIDGDSYHYGHRPSKESDMPQSFHISAAAAEAGLWALADSMMPPDILEAAERWKLDHILPELWRSAFVAGWRECHRVERKKEAK